MTNTDAGQGRHESTDCGLHTSRIRPATAAIMPRRRFVHLVAVRRR